MLNSGHAVKKWHARRTWPNGPFRPGWIGQMPRHESAYINVKCKDSSWYYWPRIDSACRPCRTCVILVSRRSTGRLPSTQHLGRSKILSCAHSELKPALLLANDLENGLWLPATCQRHCQASSGGIAWKWLTLSPAASYFTNFSNAVGLPRRNGFLHSNHFFRAPDSRAVRSLH